MQEAESIARTVRHHIEDVRGEDRRHGRQLALGGGAGEGGSRSEAWVQVEHGHQGQSEESIDDRARLPYPHGPKLRAVAETVLENRVLNKA